MKRIILLMISFSTLCFADFHGTVTTYQGELVFEKNNGFDILTPLFLEKTELIKPDHLSISNFPNPFNNKTTIRFNIILPGHTEIQIFNSTVQLIRALNPGKLISGNHQVEWDGKNNNQEEISSEVYFGIIKVNSYTKVESKVFKMIYLK